MGFAANAHSNTRVRSEENKNKIKQFGQGMKELCKLQSWSRPKYFMVVTTIFSTFCSVVATTTSCGMKILRCGRYHNIQWDGFYSVVVTPTPCVRHFSLWSRPRYFMVATIVFYSRDHESLLQPLFLAFLSVVTT